MGQPFVREPQVDGLGLLLRRTKVDGGKGGCSCALIRYEVTM
jgi:hypothetical protein